MDVINSPSGLIVIRFVSGPLAGQTYQLNKPITTIGRDPATNDIVVTDPSVSRQHARLVWQNGTWSIQKLSRENSMTLNQQDLQVQQAPLRDRDTIGLGPGTSFLFLIGASTSQL